MKKTLVLFLLAVTCVRSFAQKFETIRSYKFDDYLKYYEEYPDDDGYNGPGLGKMFTYNDKIYAKVFSNQEWICCSEENYKKNYLQNAVYILRGKNSLIKKRNEYIYIFMNGSDFSKPDYSIINDGDFFSKSSDSIYLTENMLFIQTDSNRLVSWTLLGNGKAEYRGEDETQELLNDGLAEKLGYHENARGSTKWFGEFNATTGTGPNYSNILNDTIFKTKGYEEEGPIQYWGYFIGTDKRGLSYFYQSSNIRTDFDYKKPMELKIAVLDPWTREVNVIELPAGDWNPARNENGLIAACSQCIDQEGNIYFTDCNKEKGCYEIKKLSNDWLKQYEFYGREIGRVKENHIPLMKEAKESSQDNGYNFEHEYLWILEHGKDWSKVRKVDGREGYVMNKYIEFN